LSPPFAVVDPPCVVIDFVIIYITYTCMLYAAKLRLENVMWIGEEGGGYV